MACSHVGDCPLFPKLQASLASWRTHYCDSAGGWQACARYRESLAGRPVPLGLLPNGKLVQVLDQPVPVPRPAMVASAPEPAASAEALSGRARRGERPARVAATLGAGTEPTPLMWWARLFAMLRRSA
ncbi:MAG: hypothetical protein R2749_08685 [Acidimicrobiales bacterium]